MATVDLLRKVHKAKKKLSKPKKHLYVRYYATVSKCAPELLIPVVSGKMVNHIKNKVQRPLWYDCVLLVANLTREELGLEQMWWSEFER